jgi:hypothetical protein
MKKLIILSVLFVLFGALFFGFTNPDNVPVAVLMVPIVLAFLVTTMLSLVVMRLTNFSQGRQQRQKAFAVLTGTLVAFFLVFQSTGGVVLGDVILLSLILVVAYVYISRY